MADGTRGNVLIVDDEETALKVLSAILEAESYRVLQAYGVDAAIRILGKEPVDAVITDMRMPGKTGLDLFNYVKSHHADIPVIFLTAYGTIEAAVGSMAHGAYHYFVKPPDFHELKRILAGAVEQGRLKREMSHLRNRREYGYRSVLLGDTPEMQRIYDIIQSVKDSTCSVLVSGETGTGKELIARALHFSGSRARRPFIAVNCAAIPHELIETELFGHEKGAFTGASQRRVGKIEAAAGGTLFLDEIGELDASVQSKLLRVLQEKEFSRLGDNAAIEVDFRLIASTNRSLRDEIEAGRFREDLYYRLNVVCIDVPPLRQRRSDIVKLCNSFVEEFCAREGRAHSICTCAMQALQDYVWPGNVRELKNVIEGAVVLAKGRQIKAEDLPEHVRSTANYKNEICQTLEELERITISRVLDQCAGNKSKAAKILGVSRKTLYQKIRSATLQ